MALEIGVREWPVRPAEGGRRGGKDRGYHFRIAAGSTAELAAAVRFALEWGFCTPQPELFTLIDRELAMLWRLERAASLGGDVRRWNRPRGHD